MGQIIFQKMILAVLGAGAGFAVSGGVFTTMIAIGLVPRFAGKTHTAKHIFLYEEMAVCGTLIGGIITVFQPFVRFGEWFLGSGTAKNGLFYESFFSADPYAVLGTVFLGVYGFFAGIFVGCLALAIAEMLDSIPIFARRSNFRRGMGVVILCMALGKAVGSILYFFYGLSK